MRLAWIFVCVLFALGLVACGDSGSDASPAGSAGSSGTGSGGDAGAGDADAGSAGSAGSGGSAGSDDGGATGGTAGAAGSDDGGTVVVARVEIADNELAVAPGANLTLTARAFDASGREVVAPFTWQSTDPAIATVAGGTVTGVTLGQTQITAAAGGVSSAPVSIWVNPPGTTGQGLSRAVAAGEITPEEALVYRIFYVFGDSRFPEKYRGTQPDPGADDLLMVEAENRFDTLSASQQVAITEYFFPPPYRVVSTSRSAPRSFAEQTLTRRPTCPDGRRPTLGWKTIDSTHFRVWYEGTLFPAHEAIAQQVSLDAETAYGVLVDTQKFLAPLADAFVSFCNGGDGRLDIYIDALTGINGITPRAGTVQAGSANTYAAFIIVDPAAKRSTLTHELMHAIQFAYPGYDTSTSYMWTMDATATWAASEVFPADTDEWHWGESFLRRIDEPLFYPNHYCSTGSTAPECLADASADLKMYGAYLFFQFASKKAKNGYNLVRGFFEQVPLQSDSLAALDFALIAAGEEGLATTWSMFVRAAWNKSPVAEADSFRGFDSNPTNWQQVTNTTADFDLQQINLSPSDPVMVRPPTHVDGSSGTRSDASLNELSAGYERYQFGGNVRSIVFFNGYSQQLSKSQVDIQATIGPVPHTVSRYGGEFFVSYGATPQEMKGRAVAALLKRITHSGTVQWTLEDWSEKSYVFLCQDKAAERIEELVLILSNGNFTNARNSSFDANAIARLDQERTGLYASQTPCYKYRGTTESAFVYNDGTDNIAITTTLRASYAASPRTPSVINGTRAGTAFAGLTFKAEAASVAFNLTFYTTLKSCDPQYTLNESHDFGAEFFAEIPQFDHWMPLPGGSADYAYSGQGRATQVRANACAGGTKLLPAPNSLDFNLGFSSFQKIEVGPGRLSSGTAGLVGPIYDRGDYTTPGDVTNTWCLAAVHQALSGSDVDPTACP